MATEVGRLVAVMEARTVQFERSLQRAMGSADRSANRIQRRFRDMNQHLERSFSRLGRVAMTAFAGLGVGLGGRELQRSADAWINMGNRIRAAGIPMDEMAGKQEQLFRLAQESRAELDGLIGLYQRLKIATAELGTADEDVIRLTETITKSMKLAGASTSEAAAAALQLGQALGSGVLQGDELRSIRENAPLLAQAIAREFGTTIGGLKDLGAEGQLTADRIVRAILSMSDETDRAFATLRRTGADALTQLRNAWTRYIGKVDEALGATDGFNSAIDQLTAFLTSEEGIKAGVEVATALAEAFSFAARNVDLLAAGAAGFVAVKLAAALYQAAAGVKALTLAMAKNPATILAVGAAILANELFDLGKLLGLTADEADDMAASMRAAHEALEALAGTDAAVQSFLSAIEAGSDSAAAGLDRMSAAARRAVAELARLKAQEVYAAIEPFQAMSLQIREQVRSDFAPDVAERIEDMASDLLQIRYGFERGDVSAAQFEAALAGVGERFADLGDEARKAEGLALALSANRQNQQPLLARYDYWMDIMEAAQAAQAAEAAVLGGAPASSGGAGGGAAEAKASAMDRYLSGLRAEVSLLDASGIALEQRRALLAAMAAAQEDYNEGLRATAALTAAERDEILASVEAMAAVPEIMALAMEDPAIAIEQRMRVLQELQDALANPAAMAALEAQGLSAEQAYAAVENAMRQAEAAGSTVAQLADQAASTLSSGFGQLITQGGELTDVIQRVTEALIEMIAQALILAPLQQALGGFLGGFAKGGVISGGAVKSVNAKGNAFAAGRVMPFARGGVVSRPTLFPMAKGMGLMGEAGPEAILPLARGQGGVLGVRAQGAGAGAAPVINIIDQRSADNSQPVQTRETAGPGGRLQIEIMIADAVRKEVRGGGLDRAMGDSYGLTRRGRR